MAQAAYRERSQGRTPGSEYTLQTGFTQPFGDKQTLEVGAKAIFRHTSSRVNVDTLDPAQGSEFSRAPQRTIDFNYAQAIQAAYAVYAFEIGKRLNISLGGRLERTSITADFRTSDPFPAHSYFSLLPNGNARYVLSEAASVRLAYSRRITRPFIDYLNPFVDRSNAQNISYGNPNLAPEFTDSYELSYNGLVRETTFNFSASVRHTVNAIEPVRLAATTPSVTVQTFANIAANTFYQLNVYGATKLRPEWDLSGGPDLYYIVRCSPALHVKREGITAGLGLNTSYKFKKNVTIQFSLNAMLPSPEIQGRGPATLYYSFGAKKSILQQRVDLTLNITNPFNHYWPLLTSTTTAPFNERLEVRSFQQTVRLSFSYRLGTQQQGAQRKEIKNDDVKTSGKRTGN